MGIVKRTALMLLGCVGLVACAPSSKWEPSVSATLSETAGSKGYLVIGIAEENAHNELLSSYISFDLFLKRLDAQEGAMAQRFGCTSLAGGVRGQSCDGQAKMGYRVLELNSGNWTISGVAEQLWEGFPARRVTIQAPFPAGIRFPIRAGKIAYIGDFTFSVNPETQSVVLKTHTHDEAAAAEALTPYPGLKSAVHYENPVAPQ